MIAARKLSLGFVGGGLNSAVGTAHFIAAQMDDLFSVDAGCFSRHDDVNRQTAQRWNVTPERTYDTWEQLIRSERGRLDALVILTPTPEHAEPVQAALRAGFAVICEKALASASADADEILRTIAETKGFLAVTYNYTGYPMVRELRHMIHQGRLGRIQQIHIEMPQEGFARLNREGQPATPQGWRLKDSVMPTISLDLGVHVHHMIDFLTGEKPVELVASQSSLGHFRQVVDNTMAIVRYTGGLESSIWYSKAALGYRNGLRVRVFGEIASAEWYQMDPETLLFNDHYGRQTRIDRAVVDVEVAQLARYQRFKSGHPAGFLEAFANLYIDIGRHMQSGEPAGQGYVFSAQQAWEGLRTLEAINESAQMRQWVKVDLNAPAAD